MRKEVRNRPNLTIASRTRTERVLFTSGVDGARAVGVQISTTRDGPKYAVRATREVIVCAGTFGSPQLLLLSGVGPSEQLEKLKIPVVRDLPAVGRGLLDVSCAILLSYLRTVRTDTLTALVHKYCVPRKARMDVGRSRAESAPERVDASSLADVWHRTHGCPMWTGCDIRPVG